MLLGNLSGRGRRDAPHQDLPGRHSQRTIRGLDGRKTRELKTLACRGLV